MYSFSKLITIFLLLNFTLLGQSIETKPQSIDISMVISGGVSLGAYEAGYNWAMIKMLTNIKNHTQMVHPHLRSVTGASAGSINALLSAMYWCQKDEIKDQNSIEENLFFNTWVKLGLHDLMIDGRDKNNKSTLFTRNTLKLKAENILKHLSQPIYQKGCEVPLGFTVTKSKPIITDFQDSGIKIKNQHFSVPFTLKEKNNRLILENRKMPPSSDYFISIPHIETNPSLIREVLFASSAFPGAFEQVMLHYNYEGKDTSAYFIDGGAYDNLPLQLAKELDPRASDFIFIDPDNMRGEIQKEEEEEQEVPPIGFLNSNAIPLLSAVDIFKSMRLYNAINQYFGKNSGNKLILSSRYHPITGQFLGAFGAFLNEKFRIYDYHVGVYDAVYHMALSIHKYGYFLEKSQEELMDKIKTDLGIDANPKALKAYNLFFQSEFKNIKHPKVDDSFSTIYNAFNHHKNDKLRYDITEFDLFLKRLDLKYLNDKNSFIPQRKDTLDSWYKKPLSLIINRISMLENDYAQVEGNTQALAQITNMVAWMGNNLVTQKEGFHRPLNIPQRKTSTPLVKVLQALPNEITNDIKNGGLGFAYNAYWYDHNNYIDAFEAKLSYNQSDDISDFIRLDLNIFHEYQDFLKVGIGNSFFGNVESTFYNQEGFYGLNGYVDILDIFRLTYVRRFNHPKERDYLYFGLRNIPSLIDWLQR